MKNLETPLSHRPTQGPKFAWGRASPGAVRVGRAPGGRGVLALPPDRGVPRRLLKSAPFLGRKKEEKYTHFQGPLMQNRFQMRFSQVSQGFHTENCCQEVFQTRFFSNLLNNMKFSTHLHESYEVLQASVKNLYPILGKLAPKTHPFARHILPPNIGEQPP